MPWTKKDVAGINSKVPDSMKGQWVAVANSALKSCMDAGGSDETCAPKAITQANGVIKKRLDEMNKQTIEIPEEFATNEAENNGNVQEYYDMPKSYYPGWYEAMSFQDFDDVEQAGKLKERLQKRADQFFELYWRIWNNDEVPFAQKQARWRALFDEFMTVLDEEMSTGENDMQEADYQFTESSFGAVEIVEDNTGNKNEDRAPLVMEVELIQPGWGNKRDNHYYPRDVLRRDAHVFKGLKMYATDHRENERSELTEVSVIDDIIGFSDTGAPIASVTVFDPGFAEKTRNRNKAGKLNTLECSILASGKARKGEVDGKTANIVEAITKGHSVDWVTSAGAGGKASRLVENETEVKDMGDTENLDIEQQEVEAAEVEETEIQENEEAETESESTDGEQETSDSENDVAESEPQLLSEAEVTEVLNSFKQLPAAIYKRISKGNLTFNSEETLREFVQDELDYIKELTGSGKPVHTPAKQTGAKQPNELTVLEERRKTLDAINAKHGFSKARK